MSQDVLKKRTKVKCPHCGATNSQLWIGKDAKAKDIWIKCKFCKEEFEVKM